MIDVATLLCVLVKYAVARLHMLLAKCDVIVDCSSSYDKHVPFCVYLREPSDTYNMGYKSLHEVAPQYVCNLFTRAS